MLPYNNNALKNKGSSHTVEETIFGESNKVPDKKSWAQVTEAFRPGISSPPIINKPQKDTLCDEAQGWKTVSKGPNMKTSDNLQSVNVSTHNRFEKLSETNCICKDEIMNLQEKNERLKIKFKDLKEIVDLSKV